MANRGFNSGINYYIVLGVERDATGEEIDLAYQQVKEQLIKDYKMAINKNKKDKISAQINIVDEAYDVLSDAEIRAEYDKATSQIMVMKNEIVKVTDVDDFEDDEEFEEEVERARWNWRRTGLVAAITAIIIAVGVSAYSCGKNSDKGKVVNTPGTTTEASVTPGNNNNTENTTTTTDPTTTTENENTQTETRRSVYYGDINDSELVHERAVQLTNEFQNAGIMNLNTGLPYTVGEIENILLYINGAYVPEDEQDIYDMYTEWLNLICGPLNMEQVIYQVNYRGGETSFESMVAEGASNPRTFDLTGAATFGEANGVEYLQWLQSQYFKLINSTSEEEYYRIYSEVWQSFADIMKGNGYTFYVDKVAYTITEQELLQKENIGVANQVSFWLLNFEVFRNTKTQEQYDVVQKYLSANPDEQHDTVSIDEMFQYINSVCNQEVGIDYAVDDDGNTLSTMVDGVPGQTWGDRVQSNTKAYGYERLYANGLSK